MLVSRSSTSGSRCALYGVPGVGTVTVVALASRVLLIESPLSLDVQPDAGEPDKTNLTTRKHLYTKYNIVSFEAARHYHLPNRCSSCAFSNGVARHKHARPAPQMSSMSVQITERNRNPCSTRPLCPSPPCRHVLHTGSSRQHTRGLSRTNFPSPPRQKVTTPYMEKRTHTCRSVNSNADALLSTQSHATPAGHSQAKIARTSRARSGRTPPPSPSFSQTPPFCSECRAGGSWRSRAPTGFSSEFWRWGAFVRSRS